MEKTRLLKISLVVMATLIAIGGCGSEVLAQKKEPRVASKTADRQINEIDRLRQRANLEIDRRIKALDAVLNRLSNSQKLQNVDKSALLSQVDSEIAGLSALKIKINSDSTISALKSDIETITKEYRVYVLILPKVHIFVAAARINSLADEFTKVQNSLQTKINEAKNSGKDVSALESLMSDLQTQVNNAKNMASKANSEIINLTPNEYNANKAILNSPKQNLKSAREDLRKAREDARRIKDGLK